MLKKILSVILAATMVLSLAACGGTENAGKGKIKVGIIGCGNISQYHLQGYAALDDVEIESELFAEIIKASKNNYEMGIIYFPFRILGKVEDFEIKLALAR